MKNIIKTKMKKGQVISADQRIDVLRDVENGMSTVERVRKWGVSNQRITQIVNEMRALGYSVKYKERDSARIARIK